MRSLPRVMPAIVTPFGRREALDLGAHRANVAILADRGMKGFVLGGSTGEGPYLETGERAALATATRDAAARSFVMVGVAAESLRSALAMASEAADGGADAVLAMTPTTLVRHAPDLLEGYYRDLADASPLPVLLYSVPRVTGVEIPIDAAIRLADHERIVGLKDSGGHPGRIAQIAQRAGTGFSVFCGASAAISLAVAGGAFGAITASANYSPDLVQRVVALSQKSVSAALQAQDDLRIISAAVEQHGVAGVKHAASVTGLTTGPPRRPLRPPTTAVRREIERILTAAG